MRQIKTNPLTFRAERCSGQRHCRVQRNDRRIAVSLAVVGSSKPQNRGLTEHYAITMCEGVEVLLQAFLTSVSDEDGSSILFPDRFTLGVRSPGTSWTGVWLGHRADIVTVANRNRPRAFNS